jgi:hypothetical protein
VLCGSLQYVPNPDTDGRTQDPQIARGEQASRAAALPEAHHDGPELVAMAVDKHPHGAVTHEAEDDAERAVGVPVALGQRLVPGLELPRSGNLSGHDSHRGGVPVR